MSTSPSTPPSAQLDSDEVESPRPLNVTFDAIGVSPDLVAALAAAGIERPFPIQAATIPDALTGRDLCGQARTGSGKTLAFGIPLISRVFRPAPPGRPGALVLVPTRELALQVATVLTPLGKSVGVGVLAVYGGAKIETQLEALTDGVEIVVATPGRLIDLLEREALVLDDIRALVVDEADRMADLGFMPQVEWLLRRVPKERQTLLFSATLDGAPGSIVKYWMNDPILHEMSGEKPTVGTMVHRFFYVHAMDKAKVAAAISRSVQRTIIFCNTKRMVDRLTRELEDAGVKCAAIHGDRRQTDREKSLKRFAEGTISVLVATDVAARGIDVDGIDVVIHYEPANDQRDYLHRSGRTARAGATGIAVSLLEWNERHTAEGLIRRLGIDQPVVEVFSNDARLADLTAWDPAT
jgi:superfamily II DNA/RNA helicase